MSFSSAVFSCLSLGMDLLDNRDTALYNAVMDVVKGPREDKRRMFWIGVKMSDAGKWRYTSDK